MKNPEVDWHVKKRPQDPEKSNVEIELSGWLSKNPRSKPEDLVVLIR